MTTRTVPAAQIHLDEPRADTPAGPVRRVTLHRLQGAPAVVVLSYAGRPGHLVVPADHPLTVLSDAAPPPPPVRGQQRIHLGDVTRGDVPVRTSPRSRSDTPVHLMVDYAS